MGYLAILRGMAEDALLSNSHPPRSLLSVWLPQALSYALSDLRNRRVRTGSRDGSRLRGRRPRRSLLCSLSLLWYRRGRSPRNRLQHAGLALCRTHRGLCLVSTRISHSLLPVPLDLPLLPLGLPTPSPRPPLLT